MQIVSYWEIRNISSICHLQLHLPKRLLKVTFEWNKGYSIPKNFEYFIPYYFGLNFAFMQFLKYLVEWQTV